MCQAGHLPEVISRCTVSNILKKKGSAHNLLCFSEKFFLLFTKIVVTIVSTSRVGVGDVTGGRAADVNFMCS